MRGSIKKGLSGNPSAIYGRHRSSTHINVKNLPRIRSGHLKRRRSKKGKQNRPLQALLTSDDIKAFARYLNRRFNVSLTLSSPIALLIGAVLGKTVASSLLPFPVLIFSIGSFLLLFFLIIPGSFEIKNRNNPVRLMLKALKKANQGNSWRLVKGMIRIYLEWDYARTIPNLKLSDPHLQIQMMGIMGEMVSMINEIAKGNKISKEKAIDLMIRGDRIS